MITATSLLETSSSSFPFDAAVLYHNDNNQLLDRLRGRRPYILVGRRSARFDESFAAVGDVYGFYLATKRLLSARRRRIAFIGNPDEPELSPVTLRFHGYRQALTEAGVELTSELWTQENRQPLDRNDTNQLAEFWCRVRPDAMMAINDFSAIQILQMLQAQNVRVPNDCAVVGFDNTYVAEVCSPTLSAVHNPVDHVCHLAFSQLLRTLNLGCPHVAHTLVMPWFVRRQSCGTADDLA